MSSIREIKGEVIIDFASGTGANSNVEKISSNRDDVNGENLFGKHQEQVIVDGLEMRRVAIPIADDKVPTDGSRSLIGCYPCKDDETDESKMFYPLGDSSAVGWWGDRLADETGFMGDGKKPVLTQEFKFKRVISDVKILGDKPRDEYPTDFELAFYDENGNELFPKQDGVALPRPHFVCDTCEFIARLDQPISGVKKMSLIINKWSRPFTVAKVNYFNIADAEPFKGDSLKSLEVLEEKSSDIDTLSYGITSNYCRLSFLNKYKGEFGAYFKDRYVLLGRGRVVKPSIAIKENGEEEERYPLGTFYSEDWKLNADSLFMECKAYDELYALMDLYIIYPMDTSEPGKYKLWQNVTVKSVIEKIFELTDTKRIEQGIVSNKIKYKINIDENLRLPYVLLGEDSVWNMLQQLANYAQAFIYVDRDGFVNVESDFADVAVESDVEINPSNSFSYSIPATSKVVVNTVYVKAYQLVPVADDQKESFNIKVADCKHENGRYYFNVELRNVYTSLENSLIETDDTIDSTIFKIEGMYYNILNLSWSDNTSLAGDSFKISILNGLELRKKEYECSDSVSISLYGIKDYELEAGELFIWEDVGVSENNKIKTMAENIINKYKNGVPYVDAVWRGDGNLSLNKTFKGKSKYESNYKKYACVSNEYTIDNGLRVRTKGR